ncbi:MAG: hypothetical protein R3F59_02155 [Myxococcota bacterium]
MKNLLFALLTLAVGCVTSPLDDTYLTSKTASVKVSGQAGAASDTMTLQYLNRTTNTWVSLATTTSAATATITGTTPLYKYSFSSVVLPSNAWYLDCGAEDALMRVLEQGVELGTFTQAGWDCTVDQMFQGVPAADAGANCHTGRQFEVHVVASPC